MGADLRSSITAPAGRAGGRHRGAARAAAWHPGAATPGAAGHRRVSAFFIAAACAEGETVVTGAEELRRQGKRPDRGHGSRTRVLGVRNEVLPDGLRIEGGPIAAASSRVPGTIALPCRSRWRVCAPRPRSRSATWRMSRRPFRGSPHWRDRWASRSRARRQRVIPGMSVPVIAVDGPSGSGKGTVSASWQSVSGGTCWTAAPVPAGRPRRSTGGNSRRTTRWARGPGGGARRRVRGGRRRQRAGPAGGSQRHPDIRTETAGSAASRSRPCRRSARALLDRQRPFATPPGWWRTAATWGPWFSPRLRSRFS